MRPQKLTLMVLLSVATVAAHAAPASAQSKPWLLFTDSQSTSRCDLVNADNAKLVVLQSTGQLVLVNGVDVTLQDAVADQNGFVSFEGNPAGVIGFATDGDGLRSLWWLSLTGKVVDVNGFTGAPTETSKVPGDYKNAACDACEFWDDPTACPSKTPPTVHLCGVDVPITAAILIPALMGLRLVRRRRFP